MKLIIYLTSLQEESRIWSKNKEGCDAKTRAPHFQKPLTDSSGSLVPLLGVFTGRAGSGPGSTVGWMFPAKIVRPIFPVAGQRASITGKCIGSSTCQGRAAN